MRTVYFVLASAWGFLAGTAAILGGLTAAGQPLQMSPTVGAVLLAAGLFAGIGGIVAARAYRDAADRG